MVVLPNAVSVVSVWPLQDWSDFRHSRNVISTAALLLHSLCKGVPSHPWCYQFSMVSDPYRLVACHTFLTPNPPSCASSAFLLSQAFLASLTALRASCRAFKDFWCSLTQPLPSYLVYIRFSSRRMAQGILHSSGSNLTDSILHDPEPFLLPPLKLTEEQIIFLDCTIISLLPCSLCINLLSIKALLYMHCC